MISLGSPSASDLAALCVQPGAFLWWYADLTTTSGDALVLIWSLGLPFLPRAGEGLPSARPALSLALYRSGRPDLYLLQDYGGAECAVTIGGHPLGDGRLGASVFRSREERGQVTLEAELDEPVPGSSHRLTGTFVLSGREWTTSSPRAEHLWAPRVVHARADASLLFGDERVELSGAGYFDSNFSQVPLARQGIRRWLWGRLAFADRTVAYYETESVTRERSACVAMQGKADFGRTTSVELALGPERRGLFGVKAPRRIGWNAFGEGFEVDLGPALEDGPFYQRFLLRGRASSGEEGLGVAEVVVPSQLDIAWQRPLVRMRTHALGGKNSLWLPLFTGFRRDRMRRLFGWEAA